MGWYNALKMWRISDSSTKCHVWMAWWCENHLWCCSIWCMRVPAAWTIPCLYKQGRNAQIWLPSVGFYPPWKVFHDSPKSWGFFQPTKRALRIWIEMFFPLDYIICTYQTVKMHSYLHSSLDLWCFTYWRNWELPPPNANFWSISDIKLSRIHISGEKLARSV